MKSPLIPRTPGRNSASTGASATSRPFGTARRARALRSSLSVAALAAATVMAGPPARALPAASAAPPGFDTCPQGYVWRGTVPSDHVCVYPERYQQVREDNAQARSRVDPRGGPYGPDTCLKPYVWREAFRGDHVCVVPEHRAQAWDDNAQAAGRVEEAWLDATAVAATMSASALKGAISKTFTRLVKEKDSRVGIYGGRETLKVVSDTSDGFAGPRNRVLRFGTHGFVSLTILTDPTFYIELDLRFQKAAASGGKTDIVAVLTRWRIRTSGFGHGTLLNELRNGINEAFRQPVSFGTIPAGADFVTAGVPLDGSLKLYFKNTVAGRLAKVVAQRRLDDF
ncbi:hypothetical protein AB0K60_02385 [Thermopolyspora sp. NPDC052614]|uniref:hypothetical protein n=1 Tax=Thermopolyspora sp. NPDC052614 TaxID=3155682 RepID=UPI00342FC644